MTPVFQTKLLAHHGAGNCLAAVVASLLDKQIDEVPNFEVLGEGDLWKMVLSEWMADQHQLLVEPDRELLAYYRADKPWPDEYNDVPHVCYGAVAGLPHVVIMANARLVHDPTPKGAGLDVVSEVWVLRHRLNGLGGLHRGDLLKLADIQYSTVPQVPFYDA